MSSPSVVGISRTSTEDMTPAAAGLSIQLESKIQQVTAGLLPAYSRHLLNIAAINAENATVISDYIAALKVEVSPADHYRRDNIELLIKLARNCGDHNFKDLTREDIIAFLDSIRKPESVDPLHKWIGTYNLFRIELFRFFKWLYSPASIDASKRPKPSVIENIPKLRRKEVSIYKPSDLWTPEDDLFVFEILSF